MPRKVTIAATGALALSALGGLTAAQALSDDGRSSERETLHLTAKAVHQEFIDEEPPGLSQGDRFVFANDLYRHGQKVGEDGGACTLTRVDGAGVATFQCLGSNALPGGHVTAQGLTNSKDTREVLAITGGTGRYKTARGEIRITEVSDKELDLTFVIVR
jgi:hypothetical protein